MIEEKYLFGRDLTKAIQDIINESKNELCLISPYVAISKEVKDALLDKLEERNPKFKLKILFGKNGLKELEKGRQPKLKESLKFFMKFPNCEIKFEERLHAKFYINDYHMIFSSMNLYDFSESQNIEFGVLEEHSGKGLLFKAWDSFDKAQKDVVDKVRESVAGVSSKVNPVEKFNSYFEKADMVFQSEANLEDKKGFGAKLISGLGIEQKQISDNNNIIVDKLSVLFGEMKTEKKEAIEEVKSFEGKLVSATVLGKPLDLSFKQVVESLSKNGFISEDGKDLLTKGKEIGIQMKSSDKGEWLVYPESIRTHLP